MIIVRFFAMLKNKAGKEVIEIPFSKGITLRELQDDIAKEFPQLTEYLSGKRVLVSVNEEFAAPDTVIKDGDEVAFLPPFSGG